MTILEIKKIMKRQKVTYEELSRESNIPLNTIKKIFSGKTQNPRIDTMRAIENALGVSSDGIFTAEDYANGIRDTIKVAVTPIEDDLLYLFRQIGNKYGEIGQKAFLEMGEVLLKMNDKNQL